MQRMDQAIPVENKPIWEIDIVIGGPDVGGSTRNA